MRALAIHHIPASDNGRTVFIDPRFARSYRTADPLEIMEEWDRQTLAAIRGEIARISARRAVRGQTHD